MTRSNFEVGGQTDVHAPGGTSSDGAYGYEGLDPW